MGTEPEYKLVKFFEKVQKGKVLNIGIGEGRNSFLFAKHGFEVDGIEVYQVADRSGREVAQQFSNYGNPNEHLQVADKAFDD